MNVVRAYQEFEQWFQSAAGCRMSVEIHKVLHDISVIRQGRSILQLGSCGKNSWHRSLKYHYFCRMSPVMGTGIDVLGAPDMLPFVHASFQVVFAPFIFDLLDHAPQDIVYELDRVLESMGYVVMLGLNPFGLWKISRYLTTHPAQQWYQRHSGCSFWHLRTLLRSMGYQQIYADFFYYIPPTQSKYLLKSFEWVQGCSKFITVYPSACFVLVMQKRELALLGPTLVKSSLW